MYPPAPRIEWSEDGARLLACQGGRVRVFELDGEGERTLDGDGYVDARWLPGGGVLAVSPQYRARFTLHGEPYRELPEPTPYATYYAQRRFVLSERGAAQVSWDGYTGGRWSQVHVTADGPPNIAWTFEPRQYRIRMVAAMTTAELSPDGGIIAIGYQAPGPPPAEGTTAFGPPIERGWLVASTGTRSSALAPAPLIHQVAYAQEAEPRPIRFAFAGDRRVAVCGPGIDDDRGVIRIGRGDGTKPRMPGGGAHAVALDVRGVLAAYAYVAGAGERRLRIDYLSPKPSGPAIVEVLDTLWIDPDLEHVAALAFDRESRLIACLGADGAVELVPVP